MNSVPRDEADTTDLFALFVARRGHALWKSVIESAERPLAPWCAGSMPSWLNPGSPGSHLGEKSRPAASGWEIGCRRRADLFRALGRSTWIDEGTRALCPWAERFWRCAARSGPPA